MYLTRKYGLRKTKRYRTYLYIRRRSYRGVYLSRDIPLGRIDRREPHKTVSLWLRNSDHLPDELKRLSRDDIEHLYRAVLTGGTWSRVERHLPLERSAYMHPWNLETSHTEAAPKQ